MKAVKNPWSEEHKAIIIDGEAYFTMKQVAKITGKETITIQQMASRGDKTCYGRLPMYTFPDIFDLRLIKVADMFSYPWFRGRGMPTVRNGKVKCETFATDGSKRVIGWPVQYTTED